MPFAIISIIIAAVGLLPLIIYVLACYETMQGRGQWQYEQHAFWVSKKKDPTMILAMGFVGLCIHGIGLGCGITGLCLKSKTISLIGMIGNLIIIAIILLFGLIALS